MIHTSDNEEIPMTDTDTDTMDALTKALDDLAAANAETKARRMAHLEKLVLRESYAAENAGTRPNEITVEGMNCLVFRWALAVTGARGDYRASLVAHVRRVRPNGTPHEIEFGFGFTEWTRGWSGQ